MSLTMKAVQGARVRERLPHPVLFQEGSKWRFVSRCRIRMTGQYFSPGEEFKVEHVYGEASVRTFAVSGKCPGGHGFRINSDYHKFKFKPQIFGTLRHNEVYRFVEQTGVAKTNLVYYLARKKASEGSGYYFGGAKNYPNVNSFADARYYISLHRALKALMNGNRIRMHDGFYEFYRLMAYDLEADQHYEIEIAENVIDAARWVNKNLSGRQLRSHSDQIVADAILRPIENFNGLFIVKGDLDFLEFHELTKRLGVKARAAGEGYAFMASLEDAMLLKVATSGLEVMEVATC